jgi:maltooligosyltrehalose synthase
MLAPRPSPLGIPAATYHLQFSHQFTFAHAAELVPCLRELGISESYASPILTARHLISSAPAEGARRALVATGRFFLALTGAAPSVGERVWSGTALWLPPEWEECRFRDIFTRRILTPLTRGGLAPLSMADLFGHLPVTLLEGLDE